MRYRERIEVLEENARTIWPKMLAGATKASIMQDTGLTAAQVMAAASRAALLALKTRGSDSEIARLVCSLAGLARIRFDPSPTGFTTLNDTVPPKESFEKIARLLREMGLPDSWNRRAIHNCVWATYAKVLWREAYEADRKARDFTYPLKRTEVEVIERLNYRSKTEVQSALRSGELRAGLRLPPQEPRFYGELVVYWPKWNAIRQWAGIPRDQCGGRGVRREVNLDRLAERLRKAGYAVAKPPAS